MLVFIFNFISLASSLAVTSLARNTVFPCSSSYSRNNFEEFRCQNGSSCIHIDQMCDGIGDCPDASDEMFCSPPKIRSKREVACVVPANPIHGIYEVLNLPTAEPGQRFQSLVLSVRCRRGYGVAESCSQVYCINGRWFETLPKCVRFCKLEPHPSVRHVCRGSAGFIECGQYVAPGRSVKPVCNSPIYYSLEGLSDMRCVSGAWDYIARCKAECGRITPESRALVVGGRAAKRGELPWHIGVYWKATNPYKQLCGGSLISNNVAISAAHCFWSDMRKQLPASDYAVAIGKLYRDWEHDRDFDAQKSDVKDIKIPRLFQGEQANFQQDIAIVILASPFTYKPHIRPICLNYDKDFSRFQLQHGRLGKVAGWGMSTADGNPSGILQVVDMPYIDEEICIRTLPASFTEYITGDKFCAGYTNGTALCHGDSGGGLSFAANELGKERFYLRGIVSTAPRSDDNFMCNDETFTAFTKITDHEDFIKESILASLKKICPHYLFQCADGTCVDQGADCNGILDCADGSDESEELCQLASNTTITEDFILYKDPFIPAMVSPKGSTNSNICILPSHPANGKYVVLNFPNAQPGETAESWSLTVTCDPGYGVVEPGGGIEDNGILVICRGGNWSRSIPECVRYCTLSLDPSINFNCEVRGTNGYGNCDTKVASGTTVTPFCNSPHYYSPTILTRMECISGSWNYVPKCTPECGRVTPQGMSLAIGSRRAKRGELPWHVGVYAKTVNPYLQICGGSIITNKLVISAAHCFWNNVDRILPAANYAVAAGKIYRPWNNQYDEDAQKSDVKEILIPSVFRGVATNMQGDISVLILTTPFVYKVYLRPVCLSFDNSFERSQLKNGEFGKTAGWGLTEANGSASQILRVVELPYMSVDICYSSVPPSFTSFITMDKFCAGYTNGTAALCKFDSGGGLVFPTAERGVERYYIRGVTSTAPRSEDLCNPNSPTVFTAISDYEIFIKDQL